MLKSQGLKWAWGVAVLMIGGVAFAQSPAASPKPSHAPAASPKPSAAPAATGKPTHHAEKSKDDAAKLHKAATEAKVTLAQAIDTAKKEKEVADGHFVEAELESHEGGPMYEVEFLVGEKLHQVVVNAVDGKVAKSEHETPDADEKAAIEAAKKGASAKTTVAAAIEAASKEAKDAKAVQIKIALEKDAPIYKVKLVTADKVVKVHVDGATGAAKVAE